MPDNPICLVVERAWPSIARTHRRILSTAGGCGICSLLSEVGLQGLAAVDQARGTIQQGSAWKSDWGWQRDDRQAHPPEFNRAPRGDEAVVTLREARADPDHGIERVPRDISDDWDI
jgi:hypothetical protein